MNMYNTEYRLLGLYLNYAGKVGRIIQLSRGMIDAREEGENATNTNPLAQNRDHLLTFMFRHIHTKDRITGVYSIMGLRGRLQRVF